MRKPLPLLLWVCISMLFLPGHRPLPPCSPPVSLWLHAPQTPTSLTLNWSQVSGVTQYQIQYWETGMPGEKTLIGDPCTAPFVLKGLKKFTAYTLQIRSVCGASTSEWGTPVDYLTAKSAENCAEPTDVQVASTADQMVVSWTSTGDHTIRYRLGASGDWLIPSGAMAVATSPYIISGLASGVYQVEINHHCSGTSSEFVSLNLMVGLGCSTPAAPVVIPDVTSASIILPTISGVAGYNVEYRQGIIGSWINIGDNIPPSLAYLNTPLTPATQYQARIQAVCSMGSSDFSFPTTFMTLGAPPCLPNKNFGKNLSAAEKAQIDQFNNTPSPHTIGSMIGINDGGLYFRAFQNVSANPISQLTKELRVFHTMDDDYNITLAGYTLNIKPKDTSPEGTPANTARNKTFYNLYHNTHGFNHITGALELLQYEPQTWKEKIYQESDWSKLGPAGIRMSFTNYTRKYIDVFAPANGLSSQLLVANYQVGNELWDYPVKEDYHNLLYGAWDAFVEKYGPKANGGWKMKLVAGAFQAFRSGNCPDTLRNFSNCGGGLQRHDFIGDYLNVTDCEVLRDLDAVDCHPYSFLPGSTTWTYPEDPSSEDWQIRNLAGWLQANKNDSTGALVNTKLWATEYGFDSNPLTGVGEKTQSAYLIRGLLLHSRYHFEKVFFYNAFDHSRSTDPYYTGLYGSSGFWKLGTDPANSAWASPLAAHGAAPKPAWFGMLDVKNQLGSHVFYKALAEDNDAFVYLMAKPDGSDPYLVFWSPKQTTDTNINQDISIHKTIDWSAVLPGNYSLASLKGQSFAESAAQGQMFSAASGMECGSTVLTTIRRNPSFIRLEACVICQNLTSAGSILAPTPNTGTGSFDPGTITNAVSASGGQGGDILYQWQISTDSVHYTDIPGAMALSYNPPALSQTTYFRRAARRSTCEEFLYSATVVLTVKKGCPNVLTFKRYPHSAPVCNSEGDYYYEIVLQQIYVDDQIVINDLPSNGLNIAMSRLNGVPFTPATFNNHLQYLSSSILKWRVKASNGQTQTLRLYYCWAVAYPEPVSITMAASVCSSVTTNCEDGANLTPPGPDDRNKSIPTGHGLQEFKVRPNPGTDHLVLDYADDSTGLTTVRILSATGQIMLARDFSVRDSQGQHVVDTSDLPSGVYFVCLQINGSVQYRMWEKY